ncbi:hypothetical protein PspS35_14765 [Pseudomonas sp. S35]|uniref:DUF4019 domain-containing protein n=1 Tax=Pseudomonas sp. S35 TaxID=1573719 RepID=UPI00132EEA79|nr:DUF4019 domain-containing protein [Pseudomonas sp. S35]QHF44981.1 hypothetical protein PspS35_14765 [Pseudomonas sp. S35]
MKRFAVLWCSLALLSGCDISFNQNTPKVTATDPGTPQQQQQVFDTARAFLALLDAGTAQMTWPAVSPVLQAKTSQQVWVTSLKGLRLGLGSFQKREPVALGFIDQLPDAPAGNYAVIEFASTFAMTTVQEKVILRDDDKHWGIAGYFVHKRVDFADQDKKAP